MDRKNRFPYLTFAAAQLFYPLCVLVGYLTGQEFQLFSENLYLLGIVVFSAWTAVELRKQEQTLWAIAMLVLAFLHALTILVTIFHWLAGFAAIGIIVCGWLVFNRAPRGILKGLFLVFALLLTLLLLFVVPFWMIFGLIGSTKVVKQLDSPEQHYTAIVRSIDEGALGGSTLVEVRNNRKTVNILVGKFVCSTYLWQGHWGDHEGMTLSWEDETTLEIDGISYQVSGEDVSLIADISHTLATEISQGQVLEHWDDHGGFHGDGSTFVKIKAAVQIPETKYWHPLPAPENIAKALSFCRDEKDLREIPEVANGYWFFQDRHIQSMYPASYAAIHQRSSWNFTLAVYDTDTEMLYYFEFDT